jgi:hypothetical protein
LRKLSISARFVFAAGAILLVSCSSAADPGSQTPLGSPSRVTSSGPAGSPAARTCVSSSEGREFLCNLEVGTYSTEYLEPGLTYTVPTAGWASLNRQASPGNFHLFPPGGSRAGFDNGTSDDITMLSAAVPPGTCDGQPSTEFQPTFDGLVEFLMTDDSVAVSHKRDASVGGWDGIVMDITFAKSDGCPDGDYADLMVGVDPSHGAFGITPSLAGVRLYLLHNPTADPPLAIMIDDAAGGGSDYGDGEDWYDAAQSVVDTFVFAP